MIRHESTGSTRAAEQQVNIYLKPDGNPVSETCREFLHNLLQAIFNVPQSQIAYVPATALSLLESLKEGRDSEVLKLYQDIFSFSTPTEVDLEKISALVGGHYKKSNFKIPEVPAQSYKSVLKTALRKGPIEIMQTIDIMRKAKIIDSTHPYIPQSSNFEYNFCS